MPTPNKAELKSFLEAKYETVWKKMSCRERFVTCWRPYYAPVERVLKYIPNGSSVLDIGCGTGSILFLAREYCGIKEGHGVDLSQRAVDIAESVNNDACISFGAKRICELKQRDFQGFNVILCFDILHHINGNELLFFLEYVLKMLTKGSLLIIKDLSGRSPIKRILNRMTDYLTTRSHVNYVSAEWLNKYLLSIGNSTIAYKQINQLIWNHFLLITQKR